MAIVKMKKVWLIGLLEEKEVILRCLQRMGNVEITKLGDIEEEGIAELVKPEGDDPVLEQVEDWLFEVEFALDFLSRFSEEKKGIFEGRYQVSAEELEEIRNNRDKIIELVHECRKLDEELAGYRSLESRLQNLMEQMMPWKDLDVPVEQICDTARARVIAGTLEKSKSDEFLKSVSDSFEELFVEKVGGSKDEENFLLIFHKDIANDVENLLKEYGFSKATFGDLNGTPLQVIEDTRKRLKEIESKREEVYRKARELAANTRDLKIWYDLLSIEHQRLMASRDLLETGSTFVLKGWIPENQIGYLVDNLSKVTENYYVDFEDPAEDEMFPVALENPPLVRPFEIITELYSTPHPRCIDPNLYMAPFYFAFFGMMVSDAGYGLLMAVLAAIFTKKLKLKGNAGKLGWLISLGGVSTFLWGAIFGGWFGNLGEVLGIPPLWFNPMDKPLMMLGLCFGLGILQIFVGMGLKAYMSIKKGRVLDAVFDQGLWYVFLIGLILSLTQASAIGKYMAAAGAVGLVLTQGRHKKGILKKFLSGLVSLYDTTGFLSDVLSYSRLFALGLATGVIAMVINQLGAMVATTWYGWFFAAVILAGGHVFNILINALGAFVHASRLQYIEFFGKFFEGGGHAFSPLSIKTKFIDILKKEVI